MKSRMVQLEGMYEYWVVSQHSWISEKRRFRVRLLSCGINIIKINLYRGYIDSVCEVN